MPPDGVSGTLARMRDRPVVVPKAVRQKVAAQGAEGTRWLRGLGGVIEQLEHDWDVVVGSTLHGGSESYLATATTGDGVDAIIKIAIPGNDLACEATVLGLAKGHGYARLLKHDPARQAILQGGLVGLDDQEVGGVLVGDQPLGVLALGVQRVGGDHGVGQVQTVQQRPEPGDLVGLGVHLGLGQDRAAGVVHRGEQVHRQPGVMAAAAQVLPSTATARCGRRGAGGGRVVGTGGCWRASHAPTTWSRASGSTRASTRRRVASAGGRQAPVSR